MLTFFTKSTYTSFLTRRHSAAQNRFTLHANITKGFRIIFHYWRERQAVNDQAKLFVIDFIYHSKIERRHLLG
jgi:hypothetical protein